ncbi:glycosyltransferase family 4 protein [Winogradskyella sp.]|uniref:glycosyltransferase family 4 protein n=1 Tax=Winogradskyella sp. TaxID=1883156 RepID=UPI003BAAD054
MKRILFVAPYPPPFSGPESSAKLFYESNIHDFFKVELFDTNFRHSNSDKGKIGLNAIIIFFKFIFGLTKRLFLRKPHVVYYYVTATKVGWLFKDIWLILIAKLFRKKVVIHMRAGHFDYNFSRMKSFEKSIVIKVCKLVDLGLAQSESLMYQFDKILDAKKVKYVYNMIDTEIFKPSLNQKKQHEIFFMGHLSKAKGYYDIIKAMPDIIESFPNVVFTFAGTRLNEERNVFNDYTNKRPIAIENNLEQSEADVKEKFADNYNYVGIINEEQKIEQFSKSQLFILPSFSEGFSMSVLEAMAMGLPVVTTPVGALEDIIKDNFNGVLVKPNSPNDISRAVKKILGHTQLIEEYGRNNVHQVSENYSVNVVVKEYVKIFNNVLNQL